MTKPAEMDWEILKMTGYFLMHIGTPIIWPRAPRNEYLRHLPEALKIYLNIDLQGTYNIL